MRLEDASLSNPIPVLLKNYNKLSGSAREIHDKNVSYFLLVKVSHSKQATLYCSNLNGHDGDFFFEHEQHGYSPRGFWHVRLDDVYPVNEYSLQYI